MIGLCVCASGPNTTLYSNAKGRVCEIDMVLWAVPPVMHACTSTAQQAAPPTLHTRNRQHVCTHVVRTDGVCRVRTTCILYTPLGHRRSSERHGLAAMQARLTRRSSFILGATAAGHCAEPWHTRTHARTHARVRATARLAYTTTAHTHSGDNTTHTYPHTTAHSRHAHTHMQQVT